MMAVAFYTTSMLWLILHPFHVSVCDINHNSQQNLLEITVKIFADDLEVALSEVNDNPVTLKSEDISKNIKSYIHSNFHLSVNNKPSSYQYLGWEQESDAVWVYMECHLTGTVKKLEVENAILTNVFEDQTNLVHLHSKGNTKSVQINEDQLSRSFDDIDKW